MDFFVYDFSNQEQYNASQGANGKYWHTIQA